MRKPSDRVAVGLLSAGHFCVDLCQGAVPAMLPFLVQQRHLSYAAAAALVLAQALSSSILQPIFGVLTDRRPAPWLLPAGVAVAGVAVATASQLPAYALIWSAIAVSGAGVAAYHPDGARYANYSAGGRASAMSVFSVGGNAGFAAGPLITTPILLAVGLRGGWAVGLIPLGVAAALTAGLPRIASHRPDRHAERARRAVAGRDDWLSFGKLGAIAGGRSIVFYGLNTFIPLYWIGVLHQPAALAGAALGLFLATGILGTLIGGQLGDRHSWRTLMAASYGLAAPLLAALLLVPSPVLALALLVPLAIALYVPASIIVLAGQAYVPNHVGTASGVTLGLGVSLGGLVAPGVGWVADHHGLRTALLLLAALPVLVTAVILTLPGRARAASA